jgi:hypothetical protein
MSNPADIFNKLQVKVFNKANKLKMTDEITASTFTGHVNKRYTDNPEDDSIDVPEVGASDTDYVTNQPIGLPGHSSKGNRLPLESKERVSEVNDPSDDVPDPSELAAGSDKGGKGEKVPSGDENMDANVGADIGDAGVGGDMDAGMGTDIPGMGEEEEKKSPKELGRIYELKKIYARLTSLESYLSDASEPALLKLRSLVSQSIEMFEILASNIDQYTDKMDDIIVMYYKFLEGVFDILKKYYKTRSD